MLNLVPSKKIFAAGLMAAVLSATMAAPMAYASEKDNAKAERDVGLMKRVLENLEDSQRLLNQTKPGKDGHRGNAIKAVQQAIDETKMAIRSVKKQ